MNVNLSFNAAFTKAMFFASWKPKPTVTTFGTKHKSLSMLLKSSALYSQPLTVILSLYLLCSINIVTLLRS